MSLSWRTIKKARRLLNNLALFLKDVQTLVVIGMGNELHGDDGVGLHVVQLLRPSHTPRLHVFEGHMTPEVYIKPACDIHPTHVLIVDAAELQTAPGTWRIIEAGELREEMFTTHAIPASAIAAEIERRCNAQVGFLGIQPRRCDVSLSLSDECRRAAEQVVGEIHSLMTIKR